MKHLKKLFLISSVFLAACTWPLKKEQPLVTELEFRTCHMPESYFAPENYPKREWDWTQKNESDVVDFIREHRDKIDILNDNVDKLKKLYDKCKEQEKIIKEE